MGYESALVESYAAVRQRLYSQRERTITRTVLREMPEPEPLAPTGRPSSMRIIWEVCQAHKIGLRDLLSKRRTDPIVAARAEAGFRLYVEAGKSFPQVGRLLRRDHSSIINLIRRYLASHPELGSVWAAMRQRREEEMRAREQEAVRLFLAGAPSRDIGALGISSYKVRKLAGLVK